MKNDESGLDDLGMYSTENIDDVIRIILRISTAYYLQVLGTANGNVISVKCKDFSWPVNISNDIYGVTFVMGNDQIMDSGTIAIQR